MSDARTGETGGYRKLSLADLEDEIIAAQLRRINDATDVNERCQEVGQYEQFMRAVTMRRQLPS